MKRRKKTSAMTSDPRCCKCVFTRPGAALQLTWPATAALRISPSFVDKHWLKPLATPHFTRSLQ